MNKLLTYYSFILLSIMTAAGFAGASSYAQLLSAILFFPLTLYLFFQIAPKKRRVLILPQEMFTQAPNHGAGYAPKTPPRGAGGKFMSTKAKAAKVEEPEPVKLQKAFDVDRRMFLKLIGSAGISLFLLSIFTKKAQGAFFGSVPGPGTVALKDSSGAVVDPAIATPTDGYKISQIDDSSPAYYGFVEKTGKWFIMKEDSSTGAYRYTKGDSGFAASWTSRASLTYDYFDVIF